MKRTVWLWQLFGFAVTALGGTLLHFLYDLTGGATWTAPFSGVNESTFEHMKLLFWPMLVYAIIQSFFFKDYENFWCIKTRGILLGLILIPVIFYTYNGAVGKSPDLLNISIFFISAAIVFLWETAKLNRNTAHGPCRPFALFTLISLALAFLIFTFYPPHIGLFLDPVTGRYGIIAN